MGGSAYLPQAGDCCALLLLPGRRRPLPSLQCYLRLGLELREETWSLGGNSTEAFFLKTGRATGSGGTCSGLPHRLLLHLVGCRSCLRTTALPGMFSPAGLTPEQATLTTILAILLRAGGDYWTWSGTEAWAGEPLWKMRFSLRTGCSIPTLEGQAAEAGKTLGSCWFIPAWAFWKTRRSRRLC